MTSSLQQPASHGHMSFKQATPRGPAPIGVFGVAIGFALASVALLALVSALFASRDSSGDLPLLFIAALVCGFTGLWQLRRPFSAQRLQPVATMSAAIVAYLVLIAVSVVLYLITDSIGRVDDALYESVAGVSTSALTLFADPEASLSDGMLIWRAGTQWLGGLGAIMLAVGLLPFLGGSRELVGGPRRRGDGAPLAPRPMKALRRVAAIYSIVTVIVAVLFLAAGTGFRDAIAHALTTVSTGGFSTRADSIGHYDSVAVEAVAILGMLGAGSSVALAWMLWRRSFSDTRRAFELQVYLVVAALATIWVWLLRREDGSSAIQGLREALFAVVSAMTTTGHRINDWGAWPPGAIAMLLILMVVGGTAGSVAGGVRWIRVIGMAQFVWRELQRQLHPRSVRAVKVGRSTISEASVDRMHAQVVYVMTIGAVASLVLALFGEGVTEAITLTLSAISTMGPGVNEAGTSILTAESLTRPERAVLMPVMLAGRVFLYPAFVAVIAGCAELAKLGRRWR